MIQPTVYSRQQIIVQRTIWLRENGWSGLSTRKLGQEDRLLDLPIYSQGAPLSRSLRKNSQTSE